MTNWDEYKNKGYLPKELLKKHKDFYTNLFKLNKFNTNKLTAIEFGAGHGMFSEVFGDMFKKYFATEPNKVLFNELVKVSEKYNMTIINAGCEDIKLDNKKKFDMVIFSNSFQFTDYDKCIEKISSLLKPDGCLLITLPRKPFMFKFYKENEIWRQQLIKTIKYLMNLEDYQLLFLGDAFGEINYLFKKL